MNLEKFNKQDLYINKNETEMIGPELEEKVEELINELPDNPKKNELEKRLLEADNKELFIIYEEASKILNRIKVIKGQAFFDFPEEEFFLERSFEPQKYEETIIKLNRVIDEALNNKMVSIGSGKTAEVYLSKNSPEYCYKIITNPEEYKKGKTVNEEVEFLDILSDFEIEGVKTPKPYYYRMNKESHFVVMEKLNAVTIKSIIEEINPEILPKNFDYNDFVYSLEKYINSLHEKGIHHRDLHDENVMVDKETGKPRVIDFGKAKRDCAGGDDEIYKDETIKGTLKYTPDLLKIEELKNKLAKFK